MVLGGFRAGLGGRRVLFALSAALTQRGMESVTADLFVKKTRTGGVRTLQMN